MKSKTKPAKHQRECIRIMDQSPKFEYGRALIADEMGLGKTFESLMWVCQHEEFPCVILCRATLKYNWQDEIRKHFGVRALVLEGRNTKEQKQFLRSHKFIILNFQILEAWLPHLLKLKPQAIILDECQDICNRKSQSYHNFSVLNTAVPCLLALSGTPLLNRAAELWPVLNALRPDKWPSFWKYAVKHCEPKRNASGQLEYKGARKLDVLHRKMKKYCMVRRLKHEVLDLPKKTRQVIPVPIVSNSEYRKAESDFAGWLKKNKGVWALMNNKKAMNMTKFTIWRKLVIEAKITSVIKWVESFLEETDEKLVIMFCHTNPIDKMMKRFKRLAVRVDGQITDKRLRQAAVRRFQGDETCRLFVGNTRAAGVGLTLTAASNLAFAELPWTPGEIKQVEDRVHRLTQENAVTITYLVAKGSVEEKVAKKVAVKDDVLNQILDDGRNEKWQVSRLLQKL